MLSNGTVNSRRTELNWTDLTKLTQLHDALLVTRVGVTKLIGCRSAVRRVRDLQFARFLLHGSKTRRAPEFRSVQFVCCEHRLIHEVDRQRGLLTTAIHRGTDISPPGYSLPRAFSRFPTLGIDICGLSEVRWDGQGHFTTLDNIT